MSWDKVAEIYSMPSDHDLEDYDPSKDEGFLKRGLEHYKNEYKICKKCDKRFTKGSESGVAMWYEGVLNLQWTNKFIPPKKCSTYCMEKVLE